MNKPAHCPRRRALQVLLQDPSTLGRFDCLPGHTEDPYSKRHWGRTHLLSHGANIWTRRTGELHTWAALLDLQHSPTEWTENKHFLCSLLTELLGGYRSWERTVVDSTLPSLNRKSNATRKRSRDVDFLTTKPSAIYDNAKMFIDSKTCTYLRFTGNLHSSVCNQDHEQRHHIQESCHRKQQIV